jgi:cysteine desulfurase / selenocysteine lyase
MVNSVIASLPLLLHSLSAFQLSSSPHIWGKAENSHVILSISVEQSNTFGESTTLDENDIEQPPWWTSVKLPHAYIAEKVRKDFAILDTSVGGKPLVYLDSAATSQKPRAVLDALQQYYETSNANVHRGAHRLSRDATAAYEGARDDVANFIGASSRNECIFTRGATEAINLVAMTYGRTCMTSPDDEIVLTELEHHSNLVPWQILSDQTQCKLRYAHLDRETGMVDMNEFRSLLSPTTKLVTFQHVSNVMGCANPVAEMVQAVREASPNAKILLDACQSVPHQRFNVQELGVDFVAFSGHKMCGPTGIGVLWGREDLLNSMPPFLGGGEMIDQVTLEGSTFVKAPGRFEAGTPAIAQAIGLGAAIRYLNEIGMEIIEAYEHELGNYLYNRLSECQGIHILGPKEGRMGLCAFYSDDVHPSDLSAFLDVEGIAIRAGHHCCQPLHRALGYSHSARASLYFYNTKEEIDKFIEVLDKSISFFRNLSSDGEITSDHDDFVPFI